MASVQPDRTSIASPTPRNDLARATQPMASSKLVLPWPFAPCSTVRPGASSRSTFVKLRKSVSHNWPTVVTDRASATVCIASGRADRHKEIQEVAPVDRVQRGGLERIDGFQRNLGRLDGLHTFAQEHRVEGDR